MINFRLYFYLALCCLLMAFSLPARAEWVWNSSNIAGYTSSAPNACRNAMSGAGATLTYTRVELGPVAYSAMFGYNVQDGRCIGRPKGATSGPEYYGDNVMGRDLPNCPNGQYRNWSNLTCSTTQTPPPGAEPDPCADKLPIIRRYNYGANGPYVAPVYFGECSVKAEEMLACHKDANGSFCFWRVTRTGDKYTGTPQTGTGAGSTDNTSTPPVNATPTPSPPIKPPPPSTPDICKTCVPCPKGTVQAGISSDGVPMCIGTGTNPPPAPVPPPTTTKPPVTSTGADGSSVTKQDSIQQNKDGSTTTTTTTTTVAADGSKSVSVAAVTSAATSGSPGRADSNPQDDKYDLCKTNPTLSICRESSVSGTCGDISCTGDAIQCATLRAAAAMQCKMKADDDALRDSPQRALGDQIISGADPMKGAIDSAMKGETVDFGANKLDQAGFLGGGSCIAPKTFHFFGKSMVMDFASACENAQPARYIILGLAFIVAYLIVSKSVLDS